ncbi:MAG: DUF1415 domain-containing protein [Candidatus Thiodiazotropha sp.]|jgi:uncharacterized protein
MDIDEVIDATRCWVIETVVGLNLCPFAAVPVKAGLIRYVVCHESDSDGIYRALLKELDALIDLPEEDVEASLLIVPVGLDAFSDYLDMLDAAEVAIAEAGLDGVFQLASFHPNYLFEGSDDSDPANYTNRSPYPMFHLIREAPLEQALKACPEPEKIPQRNMALLREMGLEAMQERLNACRKRRC